MKKVIIRFLILFSLLLPLNVKAETSYDTIYAYKEVDNTEVSKKDINDLGKIMFIIFTYGYIKLVIYAIKEFKNE